MEHDKIALFIGAHNDDCEYGTGGMTLLLRDHGYRCVFVNVSCRRIRSTRTPHDLENYKKYSDTRLIVEYDAQELRAAAILGAKKIIMSERDDSLYICNNDNIMALKRYIEEVDPSLVFMHWPKDNHSDHAEVSKATLKALSFSAKGAEIFAFEAGPMQTMVYFYPDFYIDITGKMDQLEESFMQFCQPTANGDWLTIEKKKCALFRGHMSGYEYAEAYKIIKFPSGRGKSPILPKLLNEHFLWAGTDMYPWGSQYFQS